MGWVTIEPDLLSPNAAAELFRTISRIREEPEKIGQLLSEMEGLPLAVVLLAAAARSEGSIDGVASRWGAEGPKLLARAPAAGRSSSLVVSVGVSLNSPRLTADAKTLASALAMLPGGMAEEDLDLLYPDAGRRARANLVDLALAYRDGSRVRMLNPIREAVRELLPLAADEDDLVVRHYADLAKGGREVGRPGGAAVVERLGPEVANLGIAVTALARRDDARGACAAAVGYAELVRFTGVGGPEPVACARDACARAGYVLGQANCIQGLGAIVLEQSRLDEARAKFEEALPLYDSVGSVLGQANCVRNLGEILLRRSRYDGARARYEEALPLYASVGDVLGQASCIKGLGDVLLRRSRHDEARTKYEEALPLHKSVGDVLGQANCISRLGDILLELSRRDEARAKYEEALPLYESVAHVLGQANCIKSLGDILLRRSRHDEARAKYTEALALYESVGSILGKANCTKGLGDVLLARSRHDEARVNYEEALELFRLIPEPCSIGWTHWRLARVARNDAERATHREAAREAWACIGREDLIRKHIDRAP
jgi:tetratricopeptide (TPR) repeat protein